jgi:hypothetical protein
MKLKRFLPGKTDIYKDGQDRCQYHLRKNIIKVCLFKLGNTNI